MSNATFKTRQRVRIESRDAALKELGFTDYKHYLRSSAWAGVKARHRQEYGERCGLCDVDEGLLPLHHMTYERVGRELLSDLVLLCGSCHQTVHVLEARGDMGLDFAGLADFKRAAGYAAEQKIRQEEARSHFTPENWDEDMWVRAFQVVFQRLKRTVSEMPRDRGRALLGDIRSYADEFAAADREGRDYKPAFPESSIDFSQPPSKVLAQLSK